MNKEDIGFILGIMSASVAIISKFIESEKLAKIAFVLSFLILLTTSVYLFMSLKKKNSEAKSIKNKLKREKIENRKLRQKTCQNCKFVYSHRMDNSISFSKSFDRCALPYETNDEEDIVDEKEIYFLDNHIFINFNGESSEGKCYLINFVDGLIYLPIDNNKWEEIKGDSSIVYRKLCLERTNHLDSNQFI